MSKAIDRKEASKERLLADLEHLRFETIEKAGEGVKRLFGPNSLAAELEAEAEVQIVPDPVVSEVTESAPNNVVSLAAERAVRMSGMDSIRASVEAAHEAEIQEGYQGGVEEFSSSIAA